MPQKRRVKKMISTVLNLIFRPIFHLVNFDVLIEEVKKIL